MSRNTLGRDGIEGVQLMEGSVMWDTRSRSLAVADGRSVGRAGLVGRVFLDANANGRLDPGEEAAPDVRVRIGAQVERTDAEGAFAVWDLMPCEPTSVAVDTMSLDNPLWVPARPDLRVAVGPNAFERLDIALVMAGEVSGQVRYGASATPGRGMPLLFQHLETGSVLRVGAFSDGAFYVFGLRPGTYRVVVPAEHLARLGMTADVVTFTVDPAAGVTAVEGLEVRVEERR